MLYVTDIIKQDSSLKMSFGIAHSRGLFAMDFFLEGVKKFVV
jgi:hypothetical protein